MRRVEGRAKNDFSLCAFLLSSLPTLYIILHGACLLMKEAAKADSSCLFSGLPPPPLTTNGDSDGDDDKNFSFSFLANDERIFFKKNKLSLTDFAPTKAGGAVDPNLLALS